MAHVNTSKERERDIGRARARAIECWRRRRASPYLVWRDENSLRPRIGRGRASSFSTPFSLPVCVAFFLFFCRPFFRCISPFLFFSFFRVCLCGGCESAQRVSARSCRALWPTPSLALFPSSLFSASFFDRIFVQGALSRCRRLVKAHADKEEKGGRDKKWTKGRPVSTQQQQQKQQ